VSHLITNAATQFKQQIAQAPDDAAGYNQFAWLVGNTEGDIDEAISLSHRSLQIRPDTAGYLDTLAHCYYRKGDYASAVKYQQQAVNIDPHQKVISRMLDVFKEALAKSEAQGEKSPAP
jgi:tetratricopeptide (TPR) repeat protein